MKKDWRANIKDHDSLEDLDMREVMVFLRHQYLESAKDLSSSEDESESDWGIECCRVAEHLEAAIEEQLPTLDLLVKMEPA